MKQTITIIAALFIFSFGLKAQKNTLNIQGNVKDNKQNSIEYATVSINNYDGKLITGGVTDAEGNFNISSSRNDSIIIEISYFGTEKHVKKIEDKITAKKYNLGNIVLAESTVALQEVVLTAEKSTYVTKADKKIFTVGKDVLASVNSTNDILDQIPAITVYPEGMVSLRGNSSVQILINGKRSGLTMNNGLDQISPDNIERVEVITSPSANMDASGSSGIINVILKRKIGEGWNGQIRLTAGTPANYIANPGLNYSGEKINFFSNFRWRYSDYNGIYNLDQTFKNPTVLDRLTKREIEDRHDDGLSGYTGFDYYPTENQSVTMAFFRNQTKDTDFTTLNYTFFPVEAIEGDEVLRTGNSIENRAYNQLEVSYRLKDKFKNTFTADFQYDFWDSDKTWNLESEDYPALEQFADQLRTNNVAGSRDGMIKTDYSMTLSNKKKLDVGIKYEDRTVKNNYIAENIDENGEWGIFQDIDNKFTYEEQIVGAYVSFNNEWEKWSYKLGLRTEHTQIDIENGLDSDEPYNYTNLFPSASLGYKFSETHSLYTNYSRRIARPSLWQLYPFYEIRDFNLQDIGNPELTPSFTDNMEIGYDGYVGKVRLSSAIFYKHTKDHMTDYVSRNAFDVLVIRPVNIDSHKELGYEISGQYELAKWFQFRADGQFLHFNTSGEFQETNLSAKGYNYSGGASLLTVLPSELRLQNRLQY